MRYVLILKYSEVLTMQKQFFQQTLSQKNSKRCFSILCERCGSTWE